MSSEPKARGRSRKWTCGKPIRRPHNAQPKHYDSLAELFEAIASEKRAIPTRAGVVLMSRKERSLRTMIARALGKEEHVRELAQVLRLMIKYPDLAATSEIVILIRGKMCHV